MKTRSIKAGIILAIILSGFGFSSSDTASRNTVALHNEWEEYNKVQEYVWENICKPFNENLKTGGKASMDNFSRCPSGYNQRFITGRDSVKPDRFVNGRIVLYRGCSSTEVCDFKVCVSKDFVVVRSKGSNEYLSVSTWVKMKNQKTEYVVKTDKTVKG